LQDICIFLFVHDGQLLVQDGRITKFNAKKAVADEVRIINGVVVLFDVCAHFLYHHDMEDHFD
jgi:hypothetical protein